MYAKKYANADIGIVEYAYYDFPGTDRCFRGPAPPLEKRDRAIAFLGAASCFGRFVEKPYATLVGERLSRPVFNFGYGGARAPFYYSSPELMGFINQCRAVVIEVFSARGTGTCHIESRSDASAFLRRAGSSDQFVFADRFFAQLWRTAPARMPKIIAQIRQRYIEQMHSLLWRIKIPLVLLWVSQRAPDENAGYDGPDSYQFSFPHFVDQAVLSEIRQQRITTVEVVSKMGLPQQLPEPPASAAQDQYRPTVNRYYPSPEMHQLAAEKLIPVITEILQRTDR